MTKVLAVTNQKGGVGKTTTGINLAASLARTDRKVLLIDLDPQGNATVGSGVGKDEHDQSIYDVLIGQADISSVVVPTEGGYDLVPANADLAGAQVELIDEIGRELRLRRALEQIDDHYDYVLIDCPPSLNLLTVNALVAADAVMIPMQCEYFALEGLSALVDTVRKVREALNPKLRIEGLLRTMFDGRNTLSNEVSEQLQKHFGDKVYNTIIPRNVRLAEAPSYGKAVLHYDKWSKGAQAYLALADEIIEREEAA
ncbi:MAG: ParA family protein [Arenicellales bacterium]|nr:ParA family protein [Arenicellales bacterium]